MTADPSPFRAHATPAIAIDPTHPSTLAVAEAETRSSSCGLHISTNGGLSWADLPGPVVKEWPNCVRNTQGPIADVAFDENGTLFYAFVGWQPTDWHSRVFLARSTDMGRSFDTVMLPGTEPHESLGDSGSNALVRITLDPTRPRRVYLTWSQNYGLWNLEPLLPEGKTPADFPRRSALAISEDGGRTFGQPVNLAGDTKAWTTQPSLVVGKQGELHAFFGESQTTAFGVNVPAAHIFQATSRDGGKTFTQKVIHTTGPAGGSRFSFLQSPSPAVDRSTGNVYLAWEDTGRDLPGVLFMRSTDGASTWSTPAKLNSVDPKRRWDFSELNPSLRVAPGGRIDVAWNDWRDDTASTPAAGQSPARNALQNVYLTSSSDGGRSWIPNLRVTDRSIDRRASDVWSTGVHGTVGLSSTDATTYVTWDDSRNATMDSKAQDIYFARVRLSSEALGAGSAGGTSTATKVSWALAGVGVALGLGGAALFAASRSRRPAARALGPPPTA